MTVLEVGIRCKRFPARVPGTDHVALEGLRFSVAQGEFACLVGPSGCGKTTLLNIVGGLDRQVEGWVRLDGTTSPGHISYVFQTPRLMPWLTVLDNVRLVLDNGPAATARARTLLTAMELSAVLDAYPNRLSGGMQRRVALARAFATEPQLLLMDEPFVSLDAPAADRLRDMLTELWRSRGTTVLFVTHDLREALALGDRVLFMSASPGRVVLELPVDLPRPRRCNDSEVVRLHERLLRVHPHLLEGRVDGSGKG
jgi:ABC-type nitrate/sulfonate/bicarbonate transport system ATPase subunit